MKMWRRNLEQPLLFLRFAETRDQRSFRGGLVFEAHRLVYHSTLGLRVIKKKKRLANSEIVTLLASSALC